MPQGFTITTEACTQYYEDGEKINDEIQAQIMEYVGKLEEITGKKFGDKENPLLVSVRSGARASMPGMMDTILNLGLNEDVVKVLAEKSGNPRWAYDCYRRFIQMYSDVVMEVGKKYFEELIDKMKAERGVTQDVELTADDLKELAEQFKAEYKEKVGADFPTDPVDQMMGAVKAVFRSWNNPRAIVYRRMNDIPGSWGTAVNVQSMAFGNMGERTWWPACAPPCPSRRWPRSSPRPSPSLSRCARPWRTTTATCRTWSSPWSTASSTCCRPATASAPPPPL